MADKVQRVMEDMVPELLDLGKRKVFSGEEIREIVKRRRSFEYKISSRTPTLRDFLEYLSYEYELESIRNTRTRALKLKKRTIGDYSIIRLIHFIFKRALRKFPSDEKLWLQNIDFCLKSGSSKALQRSLISALKHNPTNSVFWLIMSDRELQNGNAKEARSAILLGLRVNKSSLILWRGFSQLETNIAYRKYLDSFSSSKLALNKGFQTKKSSVMPLIPILNHGLRRIKLEFKKEAHILFMFRQYYKLYNTLLKDGNLSRIEGMGELENQIIDSFNQSKKSQPLFPVFGIIIAIIKSDHSDIFSHFKYEIDQVFSNTDSEFVLVALTFICRLIYNCINGQFPVSNPGNKPNTDISFETINTSNIVDFGFQISESIQDFDNQESATKSDCTMENCLNLDMITWYSQTCLENLLTRDNLQIKKAIHLLKLDPDFWNCCFLEDSTVEDLIRKLSSYSVPSIQEREIWKEKLFSKEQIESIRERTVLYLSQDFNIDKFMQLVTDLKARVKKLDAGIEIQDLKLFLLEALDSLFEFNHTATLKNYTNRTDSIRNSLSWNLPQIPDNIPQIIQTYKQFIIYYGTKPLSFDHAAFIIQSINKLLDLIQIQVENDEKQPESLDFIGFSKSIFWTLYMISANCQELDEEYSQIILKLRQRIIFSSLNIFPRWFYTRKIPGILFNTLIIYSILKSKENVDNSLSGLVLKYLKSQEAGMEVRFDSSPIIEILKESINENDLAHATEILLELPSENNWLLSNSITMMSKANKDITSIIFMLSCISLLYLLLERYLENCISQENGDKFSDPNLQSTNAYLIPKLFWMWNHLNTYINGLNDFSSEEFKMNLYVRYLLLIKLIEHFKVKRILSPKFGEFKNGSKVPNFAMLVSQFNKSFPYMRSGKLPSGLSIATISTLPLDDLQFELFLKKVSTIQEYGQENLEAPESQNNSLPILNKVMQNILNPCQILAPTSIYINTNYL
ncbi:small ribosomal subunit processosome [Cryptosporidium sp. chipmunk genotype I]|uniref:small ribosomal subunit processosome n=1 Tax=Cryptosporidium sp. chipmunk genotype I TaxID=1280935 RepID=UPI00351A50FD|nr:small ribosomal subunit processosome [Cryptosporidium sp. chipmunk genotype I]